MALGAVEASMACSLGLGGHLHSSSTVLRGAWPISQLLGCDTRRPQAIAGRRRLCVEARDRQRRLLSYVLSVPQRVDRYLEASCWRRWLWAAISFSTGYYSANIVTLSFGALSVNDIFAATVTLFACELVTDLYYRAEKPSLRLWFAHCFKNGFVLALIADAVKLGG